MDIISSYYRFSRIPPFGINGIRRFPPNVAEMRQHVARHFEDMLQVCATPFLAFAYRMPYNSDYQCSIPAFEGLFPPDHDDIIRILLFRLCEWHVFAKLWLHSDESLALLDEALKKLGTQIWKFQEKTCEVFKTCELPSEAAARQRCQQAQAELGCQVKPASSTVCLKKFNTLTYKFHTLGDYTRTIRMFGTTNSYTTQIVSRLYYMMCYFSDRKSVV